MWETEKLMFMTIERMSGLALETAIRETMITVLLEPIQYEVIVQVCSMSESTCLLNHNVCQSVLRVVNDPEGSACMQCYQFHYWQLSIKDKINRQTLIKDWIKWYWHAQFSNIRPFPRNLATSIERALVLCRSVLSGFFWTSLTSSVSAWLSLRMSRLMSASFHAIAGQMGVSDCLEREIYTLYCSDYTETGLSTSHEFILVSILIIFNLTYLQPYTYNQILIINFKSMI